MGELYGFDFETLATIPFTEDEEARIADGEDIEQRYSIFQTNNGTWTFILSNLRRRILNLTGKGKTEHVAEFEALLEAAEALE